jgi:hypothetical protein
LITEESTKDPAIIIIFNKEIVTPIVITVVFVIRDLAHRLLALVVFHGFFASVILCA